MALNQLSDRKYRLRKTVVKSYTHNTGYQSIKEYRVLWQGAKQLDTGDFDQVTIL